MKPLTTDQQLVRLVLAAIEPDFDPATSIQNFRQELLDQNDIGTSKAGKIIQVLETRLPDLRGDAPKRAFLSLLKRATKIDFALDDLKPATLRKKLQLLIPDLEARLSAINNALSPMLHKPDEAESGLSLVDVEEAIKGAEIAPDSEAYHAIMTRLRAKLAEKKQNEL